MATINLGRIKPVWQGAWDSGTSYIADDIVYYNNSAWIAQASNTNSAPAGNNANWEIMSQGFQIPTQTGNSGKALVTDGSSLSWGTVTTTDASALTTGTLGKGRLPSGTVLQVVSTYFDMQSFSGTGYHSVSSLNITPTSSSNKILLYAGISVGIVAGHGTQGRFMKDSNTFNLPSSDGSRTLGHGGTEGVSSDGGGFFAMSTVDTAGTTSQITYTIQIGFENSGTNRIGTTSVNYSDSGGYGYPGRYRSYWWAMEIAG